MAMFRFISSLARNSGAPAAEGPSRVAVLSAAGITLLVTIFVFSA
jgi:hypothetical protein